MEPVLGDLAAEQPELERLLRGLSSEQWAAPTRCTGWDVADVVLHLAQTDEMAAASAAAGRTGQAPTWVEDLGQVATVDEGAAILVAQERGQPSEALLERWVASATTLVAALGGMDLSTRVTWVAGRLSACTLTSTRLAETWIHGGDIASALGASRTPTDRLGPIARLAWRTLPYAFSRAGRAPPGPIAFHLVSPSGARWDFEPDGPPTTTVSGAAVELCEVAARRVDPSATSLVAEGPEGEEVLSLVRTYA